MPSLLYTMSGMPSASSTSSAKKSNKPSLGDRTDVGISIVCVSAKKRNSSIKDSSVSPSGFTFSNVAKKLSINKKATTEQQKKKQNCIPS